MHADKQADAELYSEINKLSLFIAEVQRNIVLKDADRMMLIRYQFYLVHWVDSAEN